MFILVVELIDSLDNNGYNQIMLTTKAKPKSLLHMTKAMSYPMHKIKLIVTKIANHVLEVKIIYSPLMSSLHPNLYRLLNLSKDIVHLYLCYDNQ
ncbi:hypothetical protein Lal_00026967 [Lupinus albus]|nr:hypothetical protein Lal_00026967 [Lupinus albus]